MPTITVVYGEIEKIIEAPIGSTLGEAIARTDLPLEQPCAGRGTYGLCKVLVESGASPPDDIERKHLTPGEKQGQYAHSHYFYILTVGHIPPTSLHKYKQPTNGSTVHHTGYLSDTTRTSTKNTRTDSNTFGNTFTYLDPCVYYYTHSNVAADADPGIAAGELSW
jgi:ferredoxin